MQPLRWRAESVPPGGDRVKVSENLGATAIAPLDTSRPWAAFLATSFICISETFAFLIQISRFDRQTQQSHFPAILLLFLLLIKNGSVGFDVIETR